MNFLFLFGGTFVLVLWGEDIWYTVIEVVPRVVRHVKHHTRRKIAERRAKRARRVRHG